MYMVSKELIRLKFSTCEEPDYKANNQLCTLFTLLMCLLSTQLMPSFCVPLSPKDK